MGLELGDQVSVRSAGTAQELGRYQIVDRVYVGSRRERRSLIWKGQCTAGTGCPERVAIKCYEGQDANSRRENEERVLRCLQDVPYAISLIGTAHSQEKGLQGLALEWMDGGHLRESHRAADPYHLLLDCLDWLIPIGRVIYDARQQQILHGDIRLQNILVDELGIPRLADWEDAHLYGASRELEPSGQYESNVRDLGDAIREYLGSGWETMSEMPEFPKAVTKICSGYLGKQELHELVEAKDRLESQPSNGWAQIQLALSDAAIGLRNRVSELIWAMYALVVILLFKPIRRTLRFLKPNPRRPWRWLSSRLAVLVGIACLAFAGFVAVEYGRDLVGSVDPKMVLQQACDRWAALCFQTTPRPRPSVTVPALSSKPAGNLASATAVSEALPTLHPGNSITPGPSDSSSSPSGLGRAGGSGSATTVASTLESAAASNSTAVPKAQEPYAGLIGYYALFDPTETGMPPQDSAFATHLVVSRRDKKLDFAWTKDLPVGLKSDAPVAVRWLGYLRADRPGTFEFQVEAAGGLRLWIGSSRILNAWSHGEHVEASQWSCQRGGWYPIRIDYYRLPGDAQLGLHWRPPGTPMVTELDDAVLKAVATSPVADALFVHVVNGRYEQWHKPKGSCGELGWDEGTVWQRFAFETYVSNLSQAVAPSGWLMDVVSNIGDQLPVCLQTGTNSYLGPSQWLGQLQPLLPRSAMTRTFVVFLPPGRWIKGIELSLPKGGKRQAWELDAKGQEVAH